MNNPELVTAPDERERCCIIVEGERCKQASRFWVGKNGVDDYTHVCGDHVDEVKRDGDAVVKL